MTIRRILHTSDWHLGQTFHGFDRTWEQQQVLDWLVEQVVAHEVDALLISGDIFDTVNPSNVAQRQWFDFLGTLVRTRPTCEVVAIAGNHDSAQRLEAPDALTRALGLQIIGLARDGDGQFDPDRLILPLGSRDPAGVWGHVAAVPYLRGDDLGTVAEWQAENAFFDLMRRRLDAVFTRLRERSSDKQARLGLFHGVIGGTSERSVTERDIRIGNSDGVPADMFPDDLTYLALGHLHKAQRAGGNDHFRYAGSPLSLHVSESEYNHQVVLVEIDDGQRGAITSISVPKRVTVARIPKSGQAIQSHDETLKQVSALPDRSDLPLAEQPFLEVRFLHDQPRPDFAGEVAVAAAQRGHRLTTVRGETPVDVARAPAPPVLSIVEIPPEEVLRLLFERTYGVPPDADLLAAFQTLCDELPSSTVTP